MYYQSKGGCSCLQVVQCQGHQNNNRVDCEKHIETIKSLLSQKRDLAQELDENQHQHNKELEALRKQLQQEHNQLMKRKIDELREENDKELKRVFQIVKDKEKFIRQQQEEFDRQMNQINSKLQGYDKLQLENMKLKLNNEMIKKTSIESYKKIYRWFQDKIKQMQLGILQELKYKVNQKLNHFIQTQQQYCRNQLKWKNQVRVVLGFKDKEIKKLRQQLEESRQKENQGREMVGIEVDFKKKEIERLEKGVIDGDKKRGELEQQLERANNKLQNEEKIRYELENRLKSMANDINRLKEQPDRHRQEDDDRRFDEIMMLKKQIAQSQQVKVENGELRNEVLGLKEQMKRLRENKALLEEGARDKDQQIYDLENEVNSLMNMPSDVDKMQTMQFQIDFLGDQNRQLVEQLERYKYFMNKLMRLVKDKNNVLNSNLDGLDQLMSQNGMQGLLDQQDVGDGSTRNRDLAYVNNVQSQNYTNNMQKSKQKNNRGGRNKVAFR